MTKYLLRRVDSVQTNIPLRARQEGCFSDDTRRDRKDDFRLAGIIPMTREQTPQNWQFAKTGTLSAFLRSSSLIRPARI